MRKPNTTTPAALKCASCILRVGFGIKIAMRNTGAPKTSLRRMRKGAGIELSKRPTINLGLHNRKAAQWMEDAWAAEWKGTQYLGELRHWKRHPAVVAPRAMRHYYANHEASKARARESAQRRYARDSVLPAKPDWIIALRIRTRILEAIKADRGSKHCASMDLLGCTIPQLKTWIAALFTEGMSWDNHGAWEIDHVAPCASFNLQDRAQQEQCFNFRNLQPLWRTDNRRKWCNVY